MTLQSGGDVSGYLVMLVYLDMPVTPVWEEENEDDVDDDDDDEEEEEDE